MKKVLIWNQNLDEIFLDTLQAQGVEVVMNLDSVNERVPSLTAYDIFYRTSACPVINAEAGPVMFSEEFIEYYGRCISRISFIPFSKTSYHRNLGVVRGDNIHDWLQFHAKTIIAIFDHYDPEEIWFPTTPHIGLDNLLFELGRQSGLKLIRCEQTPIAGKFFYWVSNRGEDEWTPEIEFKKVSPGVFKPNLFYMPNEERRLSLGAMLKKRLRVLKNMLGGGSVKRAMVNLYRGSIRRDWAWLSLLIELLSKNDREVAHWRFIRRRRFRYYHSQRNMCSKDDWAQPFVYFSLHYEPEMIVSSVPGIYSNQINAIEALNSILPEGWLVMVKENPKQEYMFRDAVFFRRLNSIAHVKVLPDDTSTTDAIANARIVASLSGTSCYEAIQAGKPGIYFGNPWYKGLPGAVCFSDDLDLNVLSKMRIDHGAMSLMINEKMSRAADGLFYSLHAASLHKSTDWQEMMRTTADSLVKISRAAENV